MRQMSATDHAEGDVALTRTPPCLGILRGWQEYLSTTDPQMGG
jgi:hypothetical protein